MQISGMNLATGISNLSSVQNNTVAPLANSLTAASGTAQTSKDDAKLKKTCKDMEAVFLNMMMTEMRKTVHKSTLFDSSKDDIMTSMLDTEVTKNMASAGGIGLADMLYRQLHREASATDKQKSQALK